MEILTHLGGLLQQKGEAIEAFLQKAAAEHPPFLYGSVDLRHSGHKLVPVDANVYPGGFNNLSKAAADRSSQAAKGYFAKHFPNAQKILIVPENHTRNLNYLENVACLRDILEHAGFEVRIGTLVEEHQAPFELETAAGRVITEYPLALNGGKLATREGFTPDVVVTNNDMTLGVPELLAACEQPVIPPTGMGWYRRRKRVHFAAYDALVRDFGEAFGIDHWLISAYFRNCGMVDFRAREGMECVATNAQMVIDVLKVKYKEYGIKDEPYVFIKADSGTYGMGVMTARSGEEILALNKKYRQKMDVIKEGSHNTQVVIQEGVPSIDRVDGATAEPMIYVVDDVAVGGAFRTNPEKDAFGNLNAPGMVFHGMCDEVETDPARKKIAQCNFNVYSLVARLATLASAREVY